MCDETGWVEGDSKRVIFIKNPLVVRFSAVKHSEDFEATVIFISPIYILA